MSENTTPFAGMFEGTPGEFPEVQDVATVALEKWKTTIQQVATEIESQLGVVVYFGRPPSESIGPTIHLQAPSMSINKQRDICSQNVLQIQVPVNEAVDITVNELASGEGEHPYFTAYNLSNKVLQILKDKWDAKMAVDPASLAYTENGSHLVSQISFKEKI